MSDPRRITDSDLVAIRRRWSTAHDRGADDYTDAGCRVLAEHAFRDVAALLDEVHSQRRTVGALKFAIYEAAHVISNLVENGSERGFGYWNEAVHWRDGEMILRRLSGMSWIEGLDAPEDAPCPYGCVEGVITEFDAEAQVPDGVELDCPRCSTPEQPLDDPNKEQ